MYKIVYEQEVLLCVAIERVESKVNELKKQGWVEQGGVSVSRPDAGSYARYSVAQAMVKKDE